MYCTPIRTTSKWSKWLSGLYLKGNCNGKISFLLFAFLSSPRFISKCGKISKLLVKYRTNGLLSAHAYKADSKKTGA